jgi:hypothetical protein
VNYMQKGQEGANVKAHYEFSNDPWKLCVLIGYNCLFSHKLWFLMEHFLSQVFLCLNFGHAHFFFVFLHYDLHSFKALHNKWHSLIMCAICEKKWLKDLMNQIKKDVICYSMFFLCILFFGVRKYFDLCFDNLINIYASHHYYITQAIW